MIKMNMKYLYNFLILTLLLTSNLRGQEFSAAVDKTTVGQNERFQVYFTFNGGDVNGLSNFTPPDFKGFRVLGGPNQSTSVQIINGKVSGSLTYTYVLVASNLGDFSIGKATVDFKGQKLSSNPLQMKVVQGQTSSQEPKSTEINQEELAKNVFIIANPDKRKVMKGEQITVAYKLYTRLNISSPQISKLPTYEGFWAEEMDAPANIRFEMEMYNGERYRVAEIKKVALFPTKTGELSVTPFELKIPVILKKRRSSNDIFDDFFNDSFFGRTETVDYLAKSNQVIIDVQSLPLQGVPASFNGAVGDFKFDVSLDKSNVEVNEAVSLKLSLSGTGNIKLLDLPEIVLPVGFEKYDPKTSESINRNGRVSGRKSVEYLIVPRIPGEKIIQPLEFSYFSPAKNKYITTKSEDLIIQVKTGAAGFDPSISGFSKEDVRLLNEDIRFISTSSGNLRKKDDYGLIKSWFWIGAVTPLLLLFIVMGMFKRQEKISGNLELLRYRKAKKIASARLKSARKALNQNKTGEYYSELAQALFGYLEDKLNLQKSEFSVDKVIEILKNQNVKSEFTESLKNIAETCERARFAPSGMNIEKARDLSKETFNLIIQLEKSIVTK